MARFDAATAVEELEYDFTIYGGAAGVIPEPSTGGVNAYFAGLRGLLREAQTATNKAKSLQGVNLEEMDEGQMAEAFDGVDDAMAEASGFQERTIAMVAELCQGSPSEDDLKKLPLRVLQAFNKWLMAQINPKAENQGQDRPQPLDRQRGTKGSRKARV